MLSTGEEEMKAAKETVIKANTDFESSYHEKIQG